MSKNLSVRFLDSRQLNNIDIINYDISRLYLEADDFLRNFTGAGKVWDKESFRACLNVLKSKGVSLYCVLPDIFTSKAEGLIEKGCDTICDFFDGLMVQSLDEIFFLRQKGYPASQLIASERLYVYNNRAVGLLKELGIWNFTHPLEVTYREAEDVSYGSLEAVVYGRAPLMVSAGCVHKNTAGCDEKQQNLILKDRKKIGFFVQNRCDYCYNVIYNSVPTMIIDEMDRLHPDCGSVRIDFTVEDESEIRRVLKLHRAYCLDALQGKNSFDFPYTRGHYHKGMTL